MNKKKDEKVIKKYLLRKYSREISVEHLKSPNFDFWSHSDPWVLLNLVEKMFVYYKLVTFCGLDSKTFKEFLGEVYRNYNWNPYHNFNHAFCVTQMMFAIISKVDWFTTKEVFVLLISAFCHDLDHPGTNNKFQIAANTPLFKEQGGISILEKHHTCLTKRLLEKMQLLKNFQAKEKKEILCEIELLILATDMAFHMEYYKSLKEIVGSFDRKNKEHRRKLRTALIKACDISNEARPFPVSNQWADCLLTEFFMQGDQESHLGLPVTPCMDRHAVDKGISQAQFIEQFTLPLFETLNQVLPLAPFVTNIKRNLQLYRELKEEI
ncbi:high affinity cGMP-specific 3',5'-cyclic phosphodiesterase 9A-like isoform X2 [Zophobas morio]|uniref:high affinity cGMP-specific 3',5'-cyclic phosphodiesterase 9A-like isoform X2 n=1 Tax=Zophobas morio TaxID=2755281 RepID=UPI003083B749